MTSPIELLKENKALDGFRVVTRATRSHEFFFVHEKLETVRATDTVDTDVTVYVSHDGKLGDSGFALFPSQTDEEVRERIDQAAKRAALVSNQPYTLVPAATEEKELPTDLKDRDPKELGLAIADAVFDAQIKPEGTINALEIFLYRDEVRVQNSLGLDKTQVKYRVMIEAIPTFTWDGTSVELYEDHRFTTFDPLAVTAEIREKMREVRDRAMAEKPAQKLPGRVVLLPKEIHSLMEEIARDHNYATVYAHAGLHKKGDLWQQKMLGDALTLTMAPRLPGCETSAYFDEDGTELKEVCLIDRGIAVGFYGANRFGQYLGEVPSGNLSCVKLQPGTLSQAALAQEPYLELVSLSGLQVDLYSDYVGGEIRLAYLVQGKKRTPVTGISFSGRLSEALKKLRLSDTVVRRGSYEGPDRLLLNDMTVL